MKPLYWLIKREYWEYRGSFLWAPLATAAAFLLLNLLACLALLWHGQRQEHPLVIWYSNDGLAPTRWLAQQRCEHLLLLAPLLLVEAVTGLVTFFYSLNALANDRRDRSILFWRSLPLSDSATVLAKVLAGGLLAPAFAMLVGLAGGWLLLALYFATAAVAGLPVSDTLALGQLGQSSLLLIALLPAALTQALPTLGWLLLCSAWARRPFLWALAIPALALLFLGWLGLLGELPLPLWSTAKDFVLRLLAGTFAVPAMVLDLAHGSLTAVPASALAANPAQLSPLAAGYRALLSGPALARLLFGLACITLAIHRRGRRDPL